MWEPVDHLCRKCGSRIMATSEMSPSGKIYKCFTCGAESYNVKKICWCGAFTKGATPNYICMPTKIIEEKKEVAELLEEAFHSCGIDPKEKLVGVLPFDRYNAIMREYEIRKEVSEKGLEKLIVPTDIEHQFDQTIELEQMDKLGLYLEVLYQKTLAEGKSPFFVRLLIKELVKRL